MGDFWEVTKLMLQGDEPLIKRPKLTEQLLNKPPFRFLHDIISEVTRTTGFAEGLFTEEELVSTNIKDKDGKVAYLTKIINCVGLALNQTVPARPLKIVAGLEPENTNKLLQMLAQAATSGGAASQQAVQGALAGEQMPAKSTADRSQRTSESQPPPPQPDTTGPNDSAPQKTVARPASGQSEARTVSDSQRGQSAQGSRPGSVDTRSADSGSERAESRGAQRVPEARAVQDVERRKTQDAETRAARNTEAAAMRPSSANVAPAEPAPRTSAAEANVRSSGAQQQQSRAPLAASSKQALDDEEAPRWRENDAGSRAEPPAPVVPQPATSAAAQRPGTATRGPLRPQSARRGPPKQPSNVVPVEKIPETKPLASAPTSSAPDRPGTARKSGRDAPQPAAPIRAGVILDGTIEDDDEEVVTVVESSHVAASETIGLSEGAGKLVRDILESRKGMETGDGLLGSTLKSESMKKEELERLRGVVQYLCQSAMPLGKSMEYLQEDMENMAKEFQFWNKEKKAHAIKLEEERRLTQEALQAPLAQMAELEDEIKQKREALDMLKAQVFRNEETIEGLLKLVMAGPSGR